MAQIRPFRLLHYPFSQSETFSNRIAPPYDVISIAKREQLLARDPFNSIRIILGDPSTLTKEELENNRRYEEAAAFFQKCVKDKILELDSTPSLLVMEDTFDWRGTKQTRRGILTTVQLEEFSKRIVLPHERTLAAPIQDRYKLMTALQAQESPVYFTCEDGTQTLSQLLEQICQEKPLIEFQNRDEPIFHRVWKMTENSMIKKVQNLVSKEPLLIADGHHRYTTALHYSQKEGKNQEESKWVLGYIAPASQPGVVLGAIHRLVPFENSIDSLLEKLNPSFSSSPSPLSWEEFQASSAPLALIDFESKTMHQLWPTSESMSPIPSVLLNDFILKDQLGIDLNRPTDQGKISFEKEGPNFLRILPKKSFGAWLKAVTVKQVIDLAKSGVVLPQKSTFFYPKVMTGFAFHAF